MSGSPLSRAILIRVAIVALAYLGFCAALFVFQRSLIYFPHPRSPAGGATITLPTDGGRVLVTVREVGGPNALVYFGGNAEDVSDSLPSFGGAFPDHAIYLLHYRG